MAKLMVSMPEQMVRNIDRWAQRESRSKSELLREAVRFWQQYKKTTPLIIEDFDRSQLEDQTEKLAKKITCETAGWNSTKAIRNMRAKR